MQRRQAAGLSHDLLFGAGGGEGLCFGRDEPLGVSESLSDAVLAAGSFPGDMVVVAAPVVSPSDAGAAAGPTGSPR
jgi:hypothetical protein